MIDGRGQHMIKRKEQTTIAINEYIAANPTALKKDVCNAVGITFTTLRTHLKSMQK